jgi:hypothetical protein
VNLFRKKLFVILLAMLFILVGCTKPNKGSPGQTKPVVTPGEVTSPDNEEEQQPGTEEPHMENETGKNGESNAGNGEEETIFEVEESKLVNGWKQLTLKDYAYTTEDWDSYSFRDDSPMISYKLHFPDNWDVEYSVFTNEKGEKVAELFPPIMMAEGQSLLDNWEANSECELISKEDIKVGDLAGVRIILRAFPHGGNIDQWYPHTYYLTDGKRVFAMNFYTLELDAEKQKMFDGIIETLEFLN